MDEVDKGLKELADKEVFAKKYDVNNKEVLLFAMGWWEAFASNRKRMLSKIERNNEQRRIFK